jgi:hypothetical protein
MKQDRKINLVIATPAYGRQVTAVYASSVLQFMEVSHQFGIQQVEVAVQSGDALISRARQDLVTRFIETPQATHLLFIDADIGFQPEQVERLLNFDVEMAVGAYPNKRLDLNKVRYVVEKKKEVKSSDLWSYGVEFENPGKINIKNGFALALYAGIGFALIQKSVFQKMIKQYPELKYTAGFLPSDPFPQSENRYALFNEYIDESTSQYLSEDRSFCRRWTRMGGEIWVDTQSRLQHVGPTVFDGDFSTQFSSESL